MSHKVFRLFFVLILVLTLSFTNASPVVAAPPTNDNFADAEVITSLPFSAAVDNTEATTESGEPVGCGSLFRSVWYAFTPPENTAVRVDMDGSAIGGTISIFLASGPSISDLTFLTCLSNGNSSNIQFQAGSTYYLRVDSFFGQAGVLQVNLRPLTPPANDNFADAEAIGSLPFSATVDNTDATTEPGEVTNCSSVFRSVWYSFAPAENVAIQVDMTGSVVGGSVSIYLATGPALSDLTSVACASTGSSTNIQVEGGKTYYLRVDSFGQPGVIQVNLGPLTPPANDNFANAEAISSLPFSATVDNTNATIESGEPNSCIFPFRSVWYSFTPAENMAIQVDMAGSAVGGTVQILLATGPALSDLTSVACAHSGNSTNIQVEGGKTYYLRVDSFGQPGLLQLSLEQITPPANDNFVDAELINSLPFSASVDNTNATIEFGEPQCGSSFRSVWYSFTPAENMALQVNINSQVPQAFVNIALASGPVISDLTCVRSAYSNLGGSTNIQVEAGKTYYLQVDSSGQPGVIQVSLAQITPPANDNFADAELISSLPFSASVDNTNATAEPGEPPGCIFPFRSVWYSFTPAENMAVQLRSPVGGSMSVFLASGPALSDLTFVACAHSGNSTNFQVIAGETYYINVDSFQQPGVLQFSLEQFAPPANDNFASAEAITTLPFNSSVDLAYATNEPGEQQFCYFMDRTLWYSFTPTETTTVRANTQGSAVNGALNIYRAPAPGISDLQFMTCSGPTDSSTFSAEANQTYYVQAGSAEVGSIQINLEQIPPVANDGFANAVNVGALPFSDTRDTSTATSASDDPVDCHNNGSVWYQFTPPSDITIVAMANTFGSDYDTTLAVYTGSRGALELVPGGCNDDFSGLQSRLVFNAVGGTTYYFMLGFCCGNGASGGGNLIFAVEEYFPAPPQAGFFFSPTEPTTFDTIQFYDNSFDPESIGIQTWKWDFGDGTPLGTDPFPTHMYAADGDYPVTLTVRTFDGRSASITQTVQVRTQPAVTIDIKPGNKHNRIMIESQGSASVQVAILSTADFNAPAQVDKNSLTFGATGDENSLRRRSLIGTPDCRVRDVNRDRIKDLVCSFLIGKTGFELGDTVGILKGQTVDGTLLEGRDLVLITAP